MKTVHGFEPIAAPDARVLILGTMPGKDSLAARRYYAHGRNAFWKIMGAIIGFDASADYDVRVAALGAAGIAVWDVLQLCTRESSLDSDIEDAVANDFEPFFAGHPRIERVCFNGEKAERSYKSLVLPTLREKWKRVQLRRLPSTSSAHAVPLEAKVRSWREAL